jgi:threonine dehydrogenase-like Zn-dependent dehydrogenase
MRAARLVAPKRFEFVNEKMPTPKDGQCLIKLKRVSICGSDIRDYYGKILPEEIYPMPAGLPCHELAGEIIESHTDAFKEGQRSIVIPARGTGGLKEYIVAEPHCMVLLPDYGLLDEWVMCQPSGTVLYACQQMGSVLGKNVLILGQGSIGLCFTMMIAAMGAKTVIATDLLNYRLTKAKEFGATHTINPSVDDISAVVPSITGASGPDIVVEAAGNVETFNMCFRLVRQFGSVIIFGLQSDQYVPIEHRWLLEKQPTIIPISSARSGDPVSAIKKMVNLRHRNWCDPARLITHHMNFTQVQKAYDMFEQQTDNVIKVVINIEE